MSKKSYFLVAASLAALTLLVALVWRMDTPPPLAATPQAASPAPAPVLPTTPPRVLKKPRAEVVSEPVATPATAAAEPSAPNFGKWADEAAKPVDFAKIEAFADWAKRWQQAAPDQRKAMIAEGMRLAAARRPEFRSLILSDPRRALEESVSRVVLQDLPKAITGLLEKPVSSTGDYKVYLGRPAPGTPAPTKELALRYFDTPEGDSYKARVYGSMTPVMTKKNVPLRGVAIDRELAVAESPVRPLEVGERVPEGVSVEQTCPVSGITSPAVTPTTPITDATPAVQVGERVILLCNGSHVSVLDDKYRNLIQASGPGGAGFFSDQYPGTSSEAIGNFRCLYIRITYPDQMRAPNTEDSAYGDMRNVARFYLDSSYGKLTTSSTVTPLIVLPHTQAWYIAKDDAVDGLGLVHSDSRAEARKLGYDSNQYNCTIVRVNGGPRLSGISWGGGDSVWVSWDGMDVLNHECGHSLGRNHANYWKTTDGTAYGQGANEEYGNIFDVMGNGSGFGAHYNTISKRALGWLPDAYVHKPVANGIFRLYAYDQPQLEEGKRYAFRVDKDALRRYYVEYHPAMGGSLPDSALVLYENMGSNAGHLIDTTPGSAGGKNDAGIGIGRTFTDPESDLHFTVVGKNASTPPSLDLAYFRGPFPGNHPPTVNLQASATTISAGGSITFTANASDPDADGLAYYWDFNDGVASTNTPVFTRTFSVVDQMTVLLTVSDMKGGETRRHVVVNVGNHGRQIVTGNISNAGVPLMGVKITAGTKYTYTDDAGNYSLVDLTAGAQTLAATLNGYTFTPQFTNPLTVVAGANVANWSVTPRTLVALTKEADATEGGASGRFVLTRTGDTSLALVVRTAPETGTATRGTDYTFSPAYVADGSYRSFTIPAGQSSLTISVVPIEDAAAEGPETIGLQLASNGNYLTVNNSYAVMTLNDNDTTLPQVSLEVTDPYATEGPSNDVGTFVFSRTGPTTSALPLSVAWSGAATNGSDYATLSSTVTIPAGQSSVTVTVTPLDNSTIETPEDVVATLNTSAAYVRNPAAQTGTVVITDDDLPVINVSVLDGDAREAGRNPGSFLITRTGSTASTLKVYYGLQGSALHGTDYMALPGEVTFPVGATSMPVIITPYDDDLGEPETQSVTLNITTFNNVYTVGPNYSATFNIIDNDDVPVIAVRAGSTTGAEPSTNGSFVFRSIGSGTGNVTVHYTVGGTATPGQDYTALSGTVTIAANGSNEVTVNVPVLNDQEVENTETVVLTITPDPSYRVYNDNSATVRIRDNESADRVMVSTWNTAPSEAGTVGKFYLSRSGTVGNLEVNYAMSGTATNGADYQLLPGTVTIPDGAAGVDVTVTPINDTLVEGTETITMTVLPGTGYAGELPFEATMYLADNETPPISVGFELPSSSTTEAAGPNGQYRDIAVTLTAASTDAVTVEYTGAGGTASGDDVDWTFVDADHDNAVIPGGVLTFPPGTTRMNIRVRIKDDGLVEAAETAIFELRNSRFARVSTSRTQHVLTITDANNPLRRVSFLQSATTRSETEGTEPLLMAILDRPAEAGQPVTVNYTVGGTATAGSDYQLAPGTITFAAGESVKLLPLTILNDSETETPETIVVTLTSPTNAELGTPVTHTITLRESSLPGVQISAAAEVVENAGSAQFLITRNGPGTNLPLTVFYSLGGTAQAGSDYTAPSGSLVIPAGANSAPLVIPLTDDGAEEPDETIQVTLTPNLAYDLGTSAQATITVLDDDALPVVSITAPTTKHAVIPTGVGLMLRAEATRTGPQGTTSVPVTWSMVTGPGTASFEAEGNGFTATTFSANGIYVLRATALYGTASGSADLTVDVGGVITAQTVGTTTAAPSWNVESPAAGDTNGERITINAAGSGLSASGVSDGFFFLAAPVTGDFDVKCRIVSVSNPGAEPSFRFGIMVRANTTANAPYAMTMHRAGGEHAFQARLTAGADPYDSVGSTQYPLPRWVRLVRAGNTFSAYYGDDGATWTQRGATQTITTMGTSPLLGLAVTSAIPTSLSTAIFDNLSFSLPTNIGPRVDAGVALSGSGPWNLDAAVSDDGRPTPTALTHFWSAVNGPGTVNFTAPSSVDTAVGFAAAGVYRLRLTANDGSITTFDETTATVTLPDPLQNWRQQNFGTTQNTGDAANDADPDGDGVSNLVEYMTGGSPNVAAPLPLTVTQSADEGFVIQYTRDPARSDGVISLEANSTMAGTWTPLAESDSGAPTLALAPDITVEEILGTSGSPTTVKITVPLTSSQRFFRLRVGTQTQ